MKYPLLGASTLVAVIVAIPALVPVNALAAEDEPSSVGELKKENARLREELAALRERDRLKSEISTVRARVERRDSASPVAPSRPADTAYAAYLPVKAPQVVSTYNTWTGFYVGAHAGVGLGSGGSQSMADPSAGPVFGGFDPVTFGGSAKLGAVGGVQFGYNWQASPAWLLGVEGDSSFASLKHSNSKGPLTAAVGFVVPGSVLSMSDEVKWLSTIRGRVGYIWDNNLLYLTGGAAWKNTDFSSRLVALAPFVSQTNFSDTQSGWVLGGGIERMLTANWILGAQYLFYQFGTERAGAIFSPGGTLPIVYTWKENVQVLRANLAYKF